MAIILFLLIELVFSLTHEVDALIIAIHIWDKNRLNSFLKYLHLASEKVGFSLFLYLNRYSLFRCYIID